MEWFKVDVVASFVVFAASAEDAVIRHEDYGSKFVTIETQVAPMVDVEVADA